MLKPIKITQQAPPIPAIKAGCFTTSVICSVILLLFSVMTTSLRPPIEETIVLININIKISIAIHAWCTKAQKIRTFLGKQVIFVSCWVCQNYWWACFLNFRRIKWWVWNVIKNVAPLHFGLLWTDSNCFMIYCFMNDY